MMLLNTATMRETSDTLQEMVRLIVSSMRKKEYDVDYSKLLGSLLPLPADYQHLLEAITSRETLSLRSVVMLSEISENTMNAQKRGHWIRVRCRSGRRVCGSILSRSECELHPQFRREGVPLPQQQPVHCRY